MLRSILFSLTLGLMSLANAQSPCENLHVQFGWQADGLGVIFTNSSTGTGFQTDWLWTFGDGGLTSIEAPVHGYPEPGTYMVCLTGTSVYETMDSSLITCVDSSCWNIVLEEPVEDPCAQLEAGFLPVVTGNTVQFSNTSTGTGFQSSWFWDFGDGSVSDNAQPSHSYAQAGTYQVCLTAFGLYEVAGGNVVTCADTICQQVTISFEASPCDSLTAQFGWVADGSEVTFTNEVVSLNWAYQWSFGDGTSEYGADPSHVYQEPGIYNVCLLVWTWDPVTEDTCFADHCATIEVVSDNPCADLQVNFDWDQGSGNTVAFAGTSTPEALGLLWYFGDGTDGFGPSVSHTYANPGTYMVCLMGWLWNPLTQDTCWSESCQAIVVEGGDPCGQLNAGFEVLVSDATVQFLNNTGGTGVQTTWLWLFGDGTTSNDAQPIHEYAFSGTYDVCLVATSIYEQPGGGMITCQDSVCQVVITGIGSPCDGLNAGWQAFGTGPTVNFQNAAVDNSWSYAWSFGDGTTGDGPNPFHIYDEPGEYYVCLIVGAYDPLTQDSCSEDLCQWITIVGQDPCDGFSVSFVANPTGQASYFFNGTSSPEADGLMWYFGDGQQGFGPAVDHTYQEPGVYQACLVGWLWNPLTLDSCWTESCQMITVGEGDPCDQLQAGFFANVGDVTVQFSNATTGTGFSTSWFWTFGDGTTSTDAQPAHIFPGLGTYEVCLVATSIYEQPGGGVVTCQDSVCQVVITGIGSPCDGLNAGWQAFGTGPTVNFQNAAVDNSWSYAWSFGDGTTGDGPNPFHIYDEPGEYYVCLIVGAYDPLTQDSCSEDLCQWITVLGDDPCSGLDVNFVPYANGSVVEYDNTSVGLGFQTSWSWSFGDGGSADGENAVHTYASGGEYWVCLSATSLYEVPGMGIVTCYDSTCQMVELSVGLDEIEAGTSLAAWPQPFENSITLEQKGGSGPVTVSLLDLSGRLVDERTFAPSDRITLDYTGIAPGGYLLRTRDLRNTRSLKVLKR